MTSKNEKYNESEVATVLLKDFRSRQQQLQPYNDYDATMKRTREQIAGKTENLEEPMKSIATRLFSVADQGLFLYEVYLWKIDYLAEALIHAIEAKNPVALANNVRALVEHLAALVFIIKEIEKLERSLHGQGQETAINMALEKAEIFIHRSYYGKSPKVTKDKREQAIHVNDCLVVLKEDVVDIEKIYEYLCEYVHPNHGSNVLVSTGQLASGRLNPPEEYHRETLDRLKSYCSHCMLYLQDRVTQRSSVFMKLKDLSDRCLIRGAKVNKVFAIKLPIAEGNGKSKETAHYFPKARTAMEAINLCYEFLEKEGYEVKGRQNGGVVDGFVYDIFKTDKGEIWFKVPMVQL